MKKFLLFFLLYITTANAYQISSNHSYIKNSNFIADHYININGYGDLDYYYINYLPRLKNDKLVLTVSVPDSDDLIDIGVDEITSVDLAFNLRKDTKYGIWYANQGVSVAMPIFDSDSNYVKINGSAVRLHDFSHGVIGQLRGNYQVIPNNRHIPYLDQFQVGGLATVRGYSEGILMGKNGYYLSGELMFPLLPREITSPRSGEKVPFIGKYVKGAVFADHAGVFPTHSEDYHEGSYFLASVGMGLRVQLPGDLSARLYWGYPLINNAYETDRKYGRFHFELTLEPNLDALLRSRSTAPQKVEKHVEADYNYDDVRHYDYYNDGAL